MSTSIISSDLIAFSVLLSLHWWSKSVLCQQCPAGQSAAITAQGQYQTCVAGISSCPVGYECTGTTSTANIRVCCGTFAGASAFCPVGQTAAVSGTGQALTCTFGVSTCPVGYACTATVAGTTGVCCGTIGTSAIVNGQCPVGQSSAVLATGQVQTCILGISSTCPVGYTCTATVVGVSGVCCTINIVYGQCPAGQSAALLGTGQVQTCILGTFRSCSVGYTCTAIAGSATGICCGGITTTTSAQCPAGRNPAITAAGQWQTCVTTIPRCPAGYTCAPTSTRLGLCCSGGSAVSTVNTGAVVVTAGQCPLGQTASLTVAGQPRACVIGLSMCPSGYQCVRTASSTGSVGLCCSGNGLVIWG